MNYFFFEKKNNKNLSLSSNNLKFIDFTGGDEHYKSKWSNQKFKMFYYLKVINFRGIIRFISLTLYHLLRKNKILKKIYNLMKIKIS